VLSFEGVIGVLSFVGGGVIRVLSFVGGVIGVLSFCGGVLYLCVYQRGYPEHADGNGSVLRGAIPVLRRLQQASLNG